MLNYRLSIKTVILIIISSLVVFAVLLAGGIIYDRFNEKLFIQAVQDWENSVAYLSDTMSSIVNRVYLARETMASNRFISAAMDYDGSDVVEGLRNYNILKTEVRNILDFSAGMGSRVCTSRFFINPKLALAQNPMVAEFSSLSEEGIFSGKFVEEKEWYMKTIEKGGAMHVFRIPGENGILYLSLAAINNARYQEKLLGVVAVRVDFGLFADMVKKEAALMALDENGEVFYVDDKLADLEGSKEEIALLAKGVAGRRNVFRESVINGERYFVGVHSFGMGVKLISLSPKSKLQLQISDISEMVITLLIVLAVLILISVALSSVVTRPISWLSKIMLGANGNINNLHVDPCKFLPREVWELYYSFDYLINEIKSTLEREKEMEIKMLQAQVNPHFLYNTLNSIAIKATLADPNTAPEENEVANMLVELSDILRYAISSPGKLVSLADELRCVRNYSNIMSRIYVGRFRLSIEVPKELEKLKVPKYIMQPLVENAIFHGKNDNVSIVDIRISAECLNDKLIIYISNNGNECDPVILNAMIDEPESSEKSEKECIGIQNVHKRIRLKFSGDGNGLRYIKSSKGLSAVMTIPKITEQEKIS